MLGREKGEREKGKEGRRERWGGERGGRLV
jgi:hypothetical protein